MSHDTQKEFFARCAAGFEQALAAEVKRLGCQRVRPLKGGVAFYGETADGLRCCLHSRIATRVQLVLARVNARDAEALYEGARKFPWEKRIAVGATICMQAHGTNANLRNTQFTALKVKDAVCDRLSAERGVRPDVDSKDPDFAVDISLHRDKATLYLNLSGPALHRRGYRQSGVQTQAPLKETLAAGLLINAGWERMLAQGALFADPMCGSGTLAIEAALMATNTAPGLLRTRWGFEAWLQHEPDTWERLLDEARQAVRYDAACEVRILAGDIDKAAVEIAQANAERAGVDGLIEFYVDDAANLGRHLKRGQQPLQTLVACNPPYGYRLEDAEHLPKTYRALEAAVGAITGPCTLTAITPDAGIDTALGRQAKEILPCRNGALNCSLRTYDIAGAKPTKLHIDALDGTSRTVNVAEAASEQYAARLRKVAKMRRKWARKAGVTSYRIYDADLPEYAFSVDLFTAAENAQQFLRIEEHRAGSGVDEVRADWRFFDGLALSASVLGIERENVFFKRARQEKGAPTSSTCWTMVREGDFVFEADLGSQHECGLALDLRGVRKLIKSCAENKTFVCLLAQGGVPSTYAAAGGASSCTTVDESELFLKQAQHLVAANGFCGSAYTFAKANVAEWLEREQAQKHTYDLIYCDLSAFPRGEYLTDTDAQLQLIAQIKAILSTDGAIILTSRNKALKLPDDASELQGLSVQDITAETLDADFERTPKIHQAFILKG